MTHKQQKAATIVHFVFTPKYRQAIFTGEVARQARHLFEKIAALKGLTIHALAIQPDHVHILVTIPRTMTIAQAAGVLKWFTSLKLRAVYPPLRKEKVLWGHRYWHHSIGGGSAAIHQYIEEQKEHFG